MICLQCRRTEFNPWMGKIPWRRGWLSTPVILPGELHGQREEPGGLQSMGENTRNIGLLYRRYIYFAYSYIIYVFLLCILLTQRSILVKITLGCHTRYQFPPGQLERLNSSLPPCKYREQVPDVPAPSGGRGEEGECIGRLETKTQSWDQDLSSNHFPLKF